ncbi:uncharacterized protein NECHADRAFT_98197 [Fusarium vanettenii 77-13-4]|uniref:Carboxylesterase type B domain-containing protein n=1 Tax=Fusarium vanettenii (strain ATCC MYA-4622 / CBS 123669 / FGSC 9596 / NRRL 45880 / 77-13-4) TaxID=660122 RepID=C7ZKB5_FUSV7|nr:uncharacterized protein NECHADRAFT_98197 [Fusarium vanettenii 77-13-4]EEU35497.1 hypothetical protein NECHADRAFT_98197 [Fusarium vanettenii 77-13-4]
MATQLEHPHLGHIRGVKPGVEGVAQYLGIQYATLAHRFAAPEVKIKYEGTVDATNFGPSVVASSSGCDVEFSLIQKPLDGPISPAISDLDSLNLNISVPIASVGEEAAKLPVLVFIHGGGFIHGGNWAPHYDLASIVAYSQSIGKPIIGVSINYRLGIPGFLDSEELRATGAPANRGLLDQQAAFQWLRLNIGGFSGDPDQITAVGQSAGGSSIMHLLDLDPVEEPIFSRAVCMSGNKLAAAVFPRSAAQDAYGAVLHHLGIDSAMPIDHQIANLKATTPEDLLAKVPSSVPLGPVVEPDQLPSFGAIKAHSCASRRALPLMIGSADFDGAIFEVMGLFANRESDSLGQGFAKCLMKTLPTMQHANIGKLLDLYGLFPIETDDADQTRDKIIQFGTDLKFFASSRDYASSWPSSSWLYYFKESNPWLGRYKGRSAHCLDIAYLFLNYKDIMDESQRKIAMSFARDVISFVNAETPWAEFHSSGKMRVYGMLENDQYPEQNLEGVKSAPSQEVQTLWNEIGLDCLVQAWDTYFMSS